MPRPHSTDEPLRVAFLTNFVSPYRLPVLKDLARTPGWDLRVFVNARTEFDRHWDVDTDGLDVVQTRTWTVRRTKQHTRPIPYEERVSLHVPVGLYGDLKRFRPHAVISCELGPRSIVASAYCSRHDVPLALWSYHGRSSVSRKKLQTKLREWLLGRCDIAVGMGIQAREVLRSYGVEDDRIVDAWNTTDHRTLIERLATEESLKRSRELAQQLGEGRKIALVVARYVPLKGIPELLGAWRALDPELRDQWRLVYVGSGPMKPLIEAAGDIGVIDAGPSPAAEMADWYGAADLHIFSTLGDVWGLVVNEAMTCGIPTLCSQHAGCSDDLIDEGVDGLLFDPTDPELAVRGLTAALQRSDLEQLGRAAKKKSAAYTIENLANSFRTATARITGWSAPEQVRREAA